MVSLLLVKAQVLVLHGGFASNITVIVELQHWQGSPTLMGVRLLVIC